MTKSLIPVLLASLCIFAKNLQAEDAKDDIWLLSGQSNANLHRLQNQPPQSDRVQWFFPDEKKFKMVTNELTGLTRTGKASPFYTAAYEVAQAGITVKMFGYSMGGQSIVHWIPREGPNKTGKGLEMLQELIKDVNQKVDVFVWYQGESDNKGSLQAYQNALKELVARVREAAQSPDMLVAIVQIGNMQPSKTGVSREGCVNVREAQRQFVIEDGNAILIPATGRPLEDNVHLGSEAQAALGMEIGRAVLKFRHKKENVNWPGPVLDQAVLSDSKTVVAHFAEVQKLSGALAADFKVIDTNNKTIKCTGIKADNTRVTLTLESEVSLPAKLGYIYEGDPKAELRDEAGNHAPSVLLEIGPKTTIEDIPTIMPNGAGKK